MAPMPSRSTASALISPSRWRETSTLARSCERRTNGVVFHTRRRYSAATTPVVCWNGREPTRRLTHDTGGARSTSALGALIRLRIEQAVQMHDEVAHMGVIDGLLGFR